MNKQEDLTVFSNIFSKEVIKLLSREAIIEANQFSDDDDHRYHPENTIYGKAITELADLKTIFSNSADIENKNAFKG